VLLIRIERLRHTYAPPGQGPIEALCGIDLTIHQGEYVAIVGANGSGKTTLARHLNALLLPTEGDVWINGRNTRDPSATRAIRTEVAMVFQSPIDQIVATIVQEDVAFGPENLGVPPEQLPGVVRSALERVGMWQARHRPPHMLSAGQQQRVAIAAALAMNPRCIVFDEATAMLDPAAQQDILHIMDELHRAGLAILTITHAMAEVPRADRVIVLQNGQIAMDDAPRAIFASDRIATMGLALPPAAELAHHLKAHIPDFPATVLAIDELVDAIVERRHYAPHHPD
jgi:energy-coupling factor transporter ATPase